MRQYVLRISDRAQRQIDQQIDWWIANRPAAPRLLAQEFARALTLRRAFSELGVRTDPQRRALRRRLAPRTQHFLYYRFDQRGGAILVTRFVSTKRRHR